jgi:Lrp/AsnC family leucine-responsive transcriptional regulator
MSRRWIRSSAISSRRCWTSGFSAEIDPTLLGRSLALLIDVRLREGVDREQFERGLSVVPQLVAANHVTGEYDHELRVVAANASEIESPIELRKRDHDVRELRSRLVLGELPLGYSALLAHPVSPNAAQTLA